MRVSKRATVQTLLAQGVTPEAIHAQQPELEAGFRARRTNAKPEQGVLNAVMALLRAHPRVAWAARINSGAYKTPDGRFIRFGFPGCPDVIGQMKSGRILMIE
jgi:hypothetical protein